MGPLTLKSFYRWLLFIGPGNIGDISGCCKFLLLIISVLLKSFILKIFLLKTRIAAISKILLFLFKVIGF